MTQVQENKIDLVQSRTTLTSARYTEDMESVRESMTPELLMNQQKVFQKLDMPEKDQELVRKLLRKRQENIQIRKAFLKMRSRMIARRKHIQQLVDTQSNYKNDLDLIWNHLREPMITASLINKEEDLIIFSNLEGLKSLNLQLEKELRQTWEKYHFYQKFGSILAKKAPFFQIYIEYLNNYLPGEKYLKELRVKNQAVNNVLLAFEAKVRQDTTSYLVKPVQRLQKYKVLLEPIIDKTQPQHPDYKFLKEAHRKFCDTVEKVNAVKDRIERNKRIQDLDRQFATPQHPILANNRNFLFEENLIWISNLGPKINVLACFFNDLIIFLSKDNEAQRVVFRTRWNQDSYFKDMEDGKTVKNVICIVGADGNATVSSGEGNGPKQIKNNLEKKSKLMSDIKNLMMIKESKGLRIEVRAMGTEELNATSLSKHTIYIIQVKIGQVRQNLYLRFNQMIEFSEKMQVVYKHLRQKPLPLLEKKMFNHNANTIETRKFMIQDFLQTVLNDEEIVKDPNFVIKELKLRQNFYELPKIIEKRVQSMLQKQSQLSDAKQEVSGQEILCATELSLGRFSYHDQNYQVKHNEQAHLQIQILTGQTHTIKINQKTTVQDLCNKVSHKIGLLMNRDFRLFHQIGKKQCRVLDHDQLVMKIFDFTEVKEQGFFSKIKQAIKGALVPETKPILIFKKYYYLPNVKEQYELKKDLVRLRLLAYQVFSQIKDLKYQLSFDEYALFSALMIYLDHRGEVEKVLSQKHFDIHHVVDKLIPDIIYKNQNITMDKWRERIHSPLKKISTEILNMIKHNYEKIKDLKKDAKINFYIDKNALCQQIVLNKIRSNPIYGTNIFYIQPHQSTLKLLQQKNLTVAHNMWLAIKYEGMSLLKPASKELVFQIKYQNVIKKTVYPSSLIFEIEQNQKQKEYRFNTYQSFQISQLVEYNKTLLDTLNSMGNDQYRNSKLETKTSIYMMDLSSYRNSTK